RRSRSLGLPRRLLVRYWRHVVPPWPLPRPRAVFALRSTRADVSAHIVGWSNTTGIEATLRYARSTPWQPSALSAAGTGDLCHIQFAILWVDPGLPVLFVHDNAPESPESENPSHYLALLAQRSLGPVAAADRAAIRGVAGPRRGAGSRGVAP